MGKVERRKLNPLPDRPFVSKTGSGSAVPKDDPHRQSAKYQMNRRRLTKVPGYASYLPRVFPFKKNLSAEDAGELVKNLLVVGRDGFALTSHPSTVDGHVTLWLSVDCCQYLQELDALGPVDFTD